MTRMIDRFSQTPSTEKAVIDKERLTPSQRSAYDELECLVKMAGVAIVNGDPGSGRSTILEAFAHEHEGLLVPADELFASFRGAPAEARAVDLLQCVLGWFSRTDLLLLDDWDDLVGQLGGASDGTTRTVLQETLYREAENSGKRLVLGGDLVPEGRLNRHRFLRDDIAIATVEGRSADDYRVLAENIMGHERPAGIDFERVFKFAPALSCHDLRIACNITMLGETVDTNAFLDAIAEFTLISNTRTHEVEDISFETMPGTEAMAKKLETHVVLPMTYAELAERFDLKAKRGVLLHGPPGTGKTSVGRALAKRMKGRFFLIDGSVNTEPAWAFQGKVQAIVKEAIDNAPSILFIDDADVLFGIPHVAGFGRYLLSLLDGLVSESASKVCVMMTAMDVSKVPEAIIRSGRVELWLETKLPEGPVRAGIIERWMSDKLPGADALDKAALADASAGFTPADLRRVANDARSYYAADLDRGGEVLDATGYALKAVEAVVEQHRAMAINLADPTLRN